MGLFMEDDSPEKRGGSDGLYMMAEGVGEEAEGVGEGGRGHGRKP